MTRPLALIEGDLAIPLPRPRSFRTVATAAYAELKERALHAVIEEAEKAFALCIAVISALTLLARYLS